MTSHRFRISTWWWMALALAAPALADEVLPSLSAEKMSEYKNAFGKAISESRSAGGVDGKAPGGHPAGLHGVTRQLREGMDSKGGGRPDHGGPPDKGPRGDDGGMKGFPGGGHDGMRPPPGFGGPGQPGGPPPGGGPGPGGPH